MNLHKYIRDIADFPKKGILYKDITPLLSDAKAYNYLIDIFYKRYRNKRIDKIIGIESRGFILGSSLSSMLKVGFIPIRKSNKLPFKKFSKSFELEYGKDQIEIHMDAIKENENVIIIDDVLATGGTIMAGIELVSEFNCNLVECAFLLELQSLKGRERLHKKGITFFSVLKT